jgi:phage gpG-like protein
MAATYPGIVVSADVKGGDRLLKALAGLQDAVSDLRPFWRNVFAPQYFGSVQDLFTTEGRVRGIGGRFRKGFVWARLSPRYKAWKEQHYPGKTILVREGDLRASVRWSHGRLGAGGIFDAQPRHLIFGTDVPYAAYHQYGTDKMPARPFLPPVDAKEYAPLLRNWIVRHAKQGRP